jgi:predicted phage terminase large subunit-like protein
LKEDPDGWVVLNLSALAPADWWDAASMPGSEDAVSRDAVSRDARGPETGVLETRGPETGNTGAGPGGGDAGNRTADCFARRPATSQGQGTDSDLVSLWPERWPLHLLLQKKQQLEAGGLAWSWDANYMGDPWSTVDSEFAAFYFEGPDLWWDPDPAGVDGWHPLALANWRCIAVDPSAGKTKTSDYSAIIKLGQFNDPAGLIPPSLHLDADIARRDIARVVRDTVRHCERFLPNVLAMESDQYGAIKTLLDQALDKAQLKRRPQVHTFQSRDNKHARIRQYITPWLARRLIKFRRDSPGVVMLLNQLKGFPTAKFDDGPDALSMALKEYRTRSARQMVLPRPRAIG